VFVHTPAFTERFRKALGIPAEIDADDEEDEG